MVHLGIDPKPFGRQIHERAVGAAGTLAILTASPSHIPLKSLRVCSGRMSPARTQTNDRVARRETGTFLMEASKQARTCRNMAFRRPRSSNCRIVPSTARTPSLACSTNCTSSQNRARHHGPLYRHKSPRPRRQELLHLGFRRSIASTQNRSSTTASAPIPYQLLCI